MRILVISEPRIELCSAHRYKTLLKTAFPEGFVQPPWSLQEILELQETRIKQ